MNRSIHDIRALLGPLNPEPEPTIAADRRNEQAAGRPQPVFSRRTMLVGAATATVVIGLSVAQVAGSTTGQPVELLATPTPLEVTSMSSVPEVSTVIDRLAAAAQRSAGPAVELPATEHLRISSWYLDSTVAGGSVTSQLQPRQSETWRRPDGSWTVTTSESGTETYPPGARAVYWPDRPPIDPTALEAWLNAIHPASRGDKALLTLQAITDLLRERALLPGERAAVLRLLGTVPGMRYAGTTVDRAGRPGEALVLETGRPALPARHTFVVDSATGTILAHEEMLTEDPGALNVSIPAVLQYETYLVAEFQ